LGYQLTSQVL